MHPLLQLPDIAVLDIGMVTVSQWTIGAPEYQSAKLQTGIDIEGGIPWPPGTDHAATSYTLYRGEIYQQTMRPECIVTGYIEFAIPDLERQRRWIDTVLESLKFDSHSPSRLLSAHFHLSEDNTRVFLHAECTTDPTSQDTLENALEWCEEDGIAFASFRCYRFHWGFPFKH